MKKYIHKIYHYTQCVVFDIKTNKKEYMRCHRLFGFFIKATYKPVYDDEQSKYLDII